MGTYPQMAFAAFLVFCRLGGCMLFAPGLSSVRIPMRIRLLAIWAASMAMTPMLAEQLIAKFANGTDPMRIDLVIGETATGAIIGLIARLYLLVLQFAGTTASTVIGLAGIPGVPIEETDNGSLIATLATTAGILAIYATGLHVEMIRAILDSYEAMPPGLFPEPAMALQNLLAALHDTSLLALRLAAPFIVYAVVVNVALGFANRFAQQISVYQATTGAVLLLGFLLLRLVWPDWMMIFLDSYRDWLLRGGGT